MIGIVKEITNSEINICVNDKIYSLPTRIYDKYNLIINTTINGDIEFDKKRNKEYFEPKHPRYNLEETIEFPIKEINIRNGKNKISVIDCFDNIIYVDGLKWQKKELFTKKTLLCRVIGFMYGKPFLRNIDYAHPQFEINKDYDFEFLGIETKILNNGGKFDVINLKGIDGCIHETPLLASQFGHKFKPDKLKCRIVSISSYLKLEQRDFIDPYFVKIENILFDDDLIINKFFYNLKEFVKTNSNISELYKQYESNSSLWAITYCNKVLPEIIFDYVSRFDFINAISAIDLLVKIENWILKSGLLDSFKKEETKTKIKIKSERIVEKFLKMRIAFDLIQSNKFDIESQRDINDRVLITAYYLRYNKNELIDFTQLFNSLKGIIKDTSASAIDLNELNMLIGSIEHQKSFLKKDELETDFTIGKYNRVQFNKMSDLEHFLKYILFQVYFLDLIDEKERRSLYLSELYKYLSIYFESENEKKQCLKLSFYFSNNIDPLVSLKDEYLIYLNDLKYISQAIICELGMSIKVPDIEEWKEIKRAKENKIVLRVRLTKKEKYGFIGDYKGINCILSKSFILTSKLMHYGEIPCEMILSVYVVETFYNFNTIQIKECDPNQQEYYFENILTAKIKVGDIIKSKVKAINNYGLFLTTFAGEGLLGINNIADLHIDVPLSEIFEIGEEFYVYILNKSIDNKIEFSFRHLQGTTYEKEFNKILFRIFAPEIYKFEREGTSIITISAEIKKRLYIQGHLFEYFSDLQYDYEGKMKYLKLAKIYYSAIQTSRSYFLNTYIGYFDILSDIEDALSHNSKNEVDSVINKSMELYKQLIKNTESIEKFPSVYRLIFFLDILQQFNNISMDSFKILTNYLFKEEPEEVVNLKRIAKIVLSNNLILSEKNDDDFMLKNLRIVYQYLKDGIFDLSDNEHERKQRDLKERIAQIRSKISNEESEKVEFKSSLIKPILDANRNKRFIELQNNSDSKSRSEIENLKGNVAKKRIIHSSMKTLVAFANSKGGELFIGINDDGEFLGLSNDYEEIGTQSRDELGLKLDEFINTYIGNSFFGLITIKFESIEKKDILVITVNESEKEVFLVKDENGNRCSDFYIRRHSSSVRLDGKELIDYFKWRFNNSNTT
ncbi:MAG: RNA-binding domain-containing protein [Bacteroidales bacterium]|jgi:predicted RNA-binding protein with RPS1 domain